MAKQTAAVKRLINPDDGRGRCAWARGDALLASYHDREWGKPITTDAGHLERMALEIFQCGLSWKIVLVKRPALIEAFGGFDPSRVSKMTGRDVERLCKNAEIIRNRMKIEATIFNARRFVELAQEHGSYRRWLKTVPIAPDGDFTAAMPVFKQHFKFMGPETVKCYLMGVGLVPPPHEPGCWRVGEV